MPSTLVAFIFIASKIPIGIENRFSLRDTFGDKSVLSTKTCSVSLKRQATNYVIKEEINANKAEVKSWVKVARVVERERLAGLARQGNLREKVATTHNVFRGG
jgi:hypothetical protein